MLRAYKVLEIAKEAQKKDCDSVFVIVGKERIGKSRFTLCLLDYLNANENSICVDKEKLGETFNSLKKFDAFQFDEAIDGLFSKEGQNKFNRELEKLFMICGQENWITFILLPDFFVLSPMFRKRRIVGLFHVYKRGRVAFYGMKGIKKINFNHEKYKTPDIKGGRPLFYDTFPNYNGRLLEAYLKKKQDKVNNQKANFIHNTTLTKPIREYSKKEMATQLLKQGYKPLDIAKQLNTPEQYIYKIRKGLK